MRQPSQPISVASMDRRAAKYSRATVARLMLFVLMTAAFHASAEHAGANGIRILQDDQEAFQARIDLIQQASTEICVACYAVDTGEVPIAVLELLRQASQRGVKVRLLVDGLMSRLPTAFERYLCLHGVQTRVYHGTRHGKPMWLNRRLHDKLLIVDSHHLIIGSRNLRNDHFGLDKDNYIDCDAYLFGEIANESQAYFNRLWSSADVQAPTDRDSIGRDLLSLRLKKKACWAEAWRAANCPSHYQSLLDQSVDRMVCRLGVQLDTGNDWSAGAMHPAETRLLHDCRSDKPSRQMQRGIIRLINSARSTLVIESPYPAFTKQLRDAITRASDRGVRVSILTNSLKSSDQLSVFAAYQNDKRRLLRHGVSLYEYDGEGCLHAKSMLIDNRVAMLGSYNFDSRSDIFNLEICVVACGETVAAALKQSINARMCKSRRIASDTLFLDTVHGDDQLRRLRMILTRTCVEIYRKLL